MRAPSEMPAGTAVSQPSASETLPVGGVDALSIAIVVCFIVCAGSIGWFHYHSDDVRTIMHHRKHRHLLEVEADDDVGIRADGVELTATSSERFRDADEDGNDEDAVSYTHLTLPTKRIV